ncbi:hypothetical protein J3R30DRAFT_3700774 [Lentinula aciculospora]|uniref:Uncharacterized protein n=1 Tax=Lentinula aciculospora TaxID=153920 RepID=A0A9W9DQ68_9AGAR|nr:hypothetical protein J3R30DRAFT_3700774 [Lentinula aciculospora]
MDTSLRYQRTQIILVPQYSIHLTQGLVLWNDIEGYVNISGVGTYTTSFEWGHADNGSVGLRLRFREIFHSVKAWLNDQQVTTADPTHPVVDISKLVIKGTNTIRVDAASTLLNAVNAVPQVKSLGQLRLLTEPVPPLNQQYGLDSEHYAHPLCLGYNVDVSVILYKE